jgi:hypothetical protein
LAFCSALRLEPMMVLGPPLAAMMRFLCLDMCHHWGFRQRIFMHHRKLSSIITYFSYSRCKLFPLDQKQGFVCPHCNFNHFFGLPIFPIFLFIKLVAVESINGLQRLILFSLWFLFCRCK